MILESVFFTIHFNLKEILPLYLQVFDKSRSARECGPHPPRQGQDQLSSTSSIPQELIMQEVRNQVREAMQEKEQEMNELRGQNRELRDALEGSLKALEDMRSGGEGRGQERPPEVRAGLRGGEPGESGEQGGRGLLHDLTRRHLLQEQLAGHLPNRGLDGPTVSDQRGDPAGLRRGEGGSSGTRASKAAGVDQATYDGG
eukprot:s9519_g1.t1